MNILKKNQVIIYTFALMLVAAGYLNYTSKINESVETSANKATVENMEVGDIGDATLVNSNDVVTQNTNDAAKENLETNPNNTVTENQITIQDKTGKDNLENKTGEDNAQEQKNLNNPQNEVPQNSSDKKINNDELNKETAQTSSNISKDEYFVKSKLERETMYSQMIESYEKILNSSNSLETQKQSATQEITKINEIKNKIMICENLIKTKGFSNSVVFVNGESVSIIIEAQSLKKEETAQIQNIISRELNAKIENIHISTK